MFSANGTVAVEALLRRIFGPAEGAEAFWWCVRLGRRGRGVVEGHVGWGLYALDVYEVVSEEIDAVAHQGTFLSLSL